MTTETKGTRERALSDAEFLDYMVAAAEDDVLVSADQVKRLRRLADYADTYVPPNWWGTVDVGEMRRAVQAARTRLAMRAPLRPHEESPSVPAGWHDLSNVR